MEPTIFGYIRVSTKEQCEERQLIALRDFPAQKVNTVPTATLRELRRTYAPTVLVEVGYHDNIEDAQWIKENIESIGRALAQSVTDYFGIPFQEPMIE